MKHCYAYGCKRPVAWTLTDLFVRAWYCSIHKGQRVRQKVSGIWERLLRD